MRTLLFLLLLLRFAAAIPFHNGVAMGREALRGWRSNPMVAMSADVDAEYPHARP